MLTPTELSAALAVVCVIALGACSDGDDAGTPVPPATAADSTSTSASVPNEPEDAADRESDASNLPVGAPLLTADGVETIELLTPASGNPPYARLEWEAVPNAIGYSVTVFLPDGEPWWGWSGPETSVTLGGLDTELDLGGPQAGSGITWFAIAHDADGEVIGTSARALVE